ncbi:MAG TPA: Holliday junction branch migration protein RuvA [Candidatus Acidoferrales bacterium]|nr:Holliday junction branch migration protein RuvA [Candidatus Acidoferrales bacterium]
MIARLSGTLVEKQPNHVIIDVAGVGYRVQIPLSTFTGLGSLNDQVTLLVHTHLREDQLQLFGFLTARERRAFELLISVSGVGPGLALKALSGMRVDELLPAIRRGDVEKLVQIPGIGKKTAERIVVELRDRLEDVVAEPRPGGPAAGTEAEVASALVNLGYERRDAEAALARVARSHPGAGFEPLFRAALNELVPARNAAPRLRSKG